MSDLLTTGQIAKRLGVNRQRVDYALLTRDIKPAGRIGILRVFREDAIDQVRDAMRSMRGRGRKPETAEAVQHA